MAADPRNECNCGGGFGFKEGHANFCNVTLAASPPRPTDPARITTGFPKVGSAGYPCCESSLPHIDRPPREEAAAPSEPLDDLLREVVNKGQALLGHDSVRIVPDIASRAMKLKAAEDAIRIRFGFLEAEVSRLESSLASRSRDTERLDDVARLFKEGRIGIGATGECSAINEAGKVSWHPDIRAAIDAARESRQ